MKCSIETCHILCVDIAILIAFAEDPVAEIDVVDRFVITQCDKMRALFWPRLQPSILRLFGNAMATSGKAVDPVMPGLVSLRVLIIDLRQCRGFKGLI